MEPHKFDSFPPHSRAASWRGQSNQHEIRTIKIDSLARRFFVSDFDQTPSGRFPFISNVSSQIFPKKKKGLLGASNKPFSFYPIGCGGAQRSEDASIDHPLSI
jgi:hypothetical protein